MSGTEESPAQRQARIRREKREAKIKAGGSERLDKITKLSGRTPEMMRNDSASPSPSPALQSQTPTIMSSSSDSSQVRAQEDFLRSMLRAQEPQQQDQAGDQRQQQVPEDPMTKLLSSLTGGDNNTDPNNPSGLPFSPDDIQNATGVPSWATSLLMGRNGNIPPTPEERKTTAIWNGVRITFSILAGVYLLLVLGAATAKFGNDPPPPATVKNPFLIFVLGELLIHGSRTLMRSPSSTKRGSGWYQLLKDVGRDGSIVLFILGASNWWNGTAF